VDSGKPPQGWYADPFRVHEARYFSAGRPTRLVRDGTVECFDEPPQPGPWPSDNLTTARRSRSSASIGTFAEDLLLDAIVYLSRGGLIGLAAAVVWIIFGDRPDSMAASLLLYAIGLALVLVGTVRVVQGHRARRADQADRAVSRTAERRPGDPGP
jgi:hypothetical protein